MSLLRRLSPDVYALLILLILWALFFWRLLTPTLADQVSFKQGDFSGQFMAFGAYQYERWTDGQVPLWNPYNNGGFPFIADTQSAVLYPPRLLTISLSYWAGGWSYNALQLEAIFHVLAYSILLYLFLSRLTTGNDYRIYGAFVGAIIGAYGGFISGYPPLQLALLEASIWLPLVLLGILEATRTPTIRAGGIVLAGFALGCSWLAGHPQTSWFCTLLALAWLAYRAYQQKIAWQRVLLATVMFGLITLGICAVTFLPSLEYLRYTTRTDLGFDGKANGFPFQDVLQFIFPYSVSLFSPLYVGIPALILGYFALIKNRDSRFWGGVACFGLLLSLGGNSVFYELLYQIPSGLSFFRGQERAAYLVSFSLSVLASYGIIVWASWLHTENNRAIRQFLGAFFAIVGGFSTLIIVAWLGFREEYGAYVSIAVLSTFILAIAIFIIWQYFQQRQTRYLVALCALIVFELFSVNMTGKAVYDAKPSIQQLDVAPNALLQTVLNDSDTPFRVDGFRGLRDNYGSLYQIMDIRGISPLFLTSAQKIIYQDYTHNPLAWELFAVKYVWSERDNFSTPTQIIAQGNDKDGAIFLHQLDNPRPFAHLVYQVDVVDSDEFARELLADARYTPRDSIILNRTPRLNLPDNAPTSASATVTDFRPEHITISINTPENAILSIAQVDYVGWQAHLDTVSTPILRAYGALIAIEIPRGEHTLTLTYEPPSYQVGAIISLLTWLGVVLFFVFSFLMRGKWRTV